MTTWLAALRSVQVTVIGRARVNDRTVAAIQRVEVLREEERAARRGAKGHYLKPFAKILLAVANPFGKSGPAWRKQCCLRLARDYPETNSSRRNSRS